MRAFIGSQRGGRGRTDLVLRGPRGAGRAEIAREACRRLGAAAALRARRRALRPPSPADAAGALLREAVLLDAQVLLEGAESLVTADAATAQLRSRSSARRRGRLLMTSSAIDQPRLVDAAPWSCATFAILAADERAKIWRELLPEIAADEIASLYRVGVGAIGRCADGARLRAERRARATAAAPSSTSPVRCARSSRPTSAPSPSASSVSQTWDDLVVPDDIGRTIAELVEQLRHRATRARPLGLSAQARQGRSASPRCSPARPAPARRWSPA